MNARARSALAEACLSQTRFENTRLRWPLTAGGNRIRQERAELSRGCRLHLQSSSGASVRKCRRVLFSSRLDETSQQRMSSATHLTPAAQSTRPLTPLVTQAREPPPLRPGKTPCMKSQAAQRQRTPNCAARFSRQPPSLPGRPVTRLAQTPRTTRLQRSAFCRQFQTRR